MKWRNSWSVLYVEDDPNDVLLLQRAFRLEEIHNPLNVAVDGAEGIAWLSGHGQFANRARYPLPDLVILDIKMPKINGLVVLKWIRAHPGLKGLPVIVLTSSYLPEDVAAAHQLGANAFIVKPCLYEELREVVRFLKYWMLHTSPPPTDERDWIALKLSDLEQRWPESALHTVSSSPGQTAPQQQGADAA